MVKGTFVLLICGEIPTICNKRNVQVIKNCFLIFLHFLVFSSWGSVAGGNKSVLQHCS